MTLFTSRRVRTASLIKWIADEAGLYGLRSCTDHRVVGRGLAKNHDQRRYTTSD